MSKKLTITPSEVHAYHYILEELTKKKGWTKEQIYTQQECFKVSEIKKYLILEKPENVVKIGETAYYLIESKSERKKVDIALKEAEEYANKINKSKFIKVQIITGTAGNSEEGYISKSKYLQEGKWQVIKENEIEVTSLISKTQTELILKTKSCDIKDVEISDNEFLKSAEEINGILHEGGIDKNQRARVISALLLALSEGSELNLDESPSILIEAINSRVDLTLKKHNKSDFSRFIKIELPSSTDNHIKYRTALVLTIQELLGLNIRSAMKSGKDILGKFYEVFLKYGNGAKEIGIVLTPRHITKFAAEVLDIQQKDIIYDPTCGTGGFLVAAFDEVKKKIKDKKKFDDFKNHALFGVEQQDAVVALALVNMIFRGDGKNNIAEGDCFHKWLSATTIRGVATAEYLSKDSKGTYTNKDGDIKREFIPPVTKVMMNPPFPKKKTDYKEYLFVEQALKQMQQGGLLFSILPYSCMVKGGGYQKWRERLLKGNTLLSVITLPEDLFYPVGVHTIGVFIEKGTPHNEKKNILWIRALNDGYLKKKGKRLENNRAQNDYPKIIPILKEFIDDQTINIRNIPKFQKVCPIDFTDDELELIPEAYLDDLPLEEDQIYESIDKLMRENIAFKIKYEKELEVNRGTFK